ncbi:MAG TPA: tRNA (adenosine(37)-N6)-threonylcarbamoyltransferase complex ATPase subunit type 1 TsaE [Anaerolineales bacterium]|nr:tRNA (adenosine(37)-N6)-threonylcarbamoyltransferase complex ATPase subunit type 1 TsaE [Anaerolineales bacterium]
MMEFSSHSPDQTRQMGMRLGAALQAGDVLCLQGNLGAGKTTFVQGLALGWGSLDSVSSPTFILVNVYRRGDEARLFHMDAYRIDSTPEAEELDLESMMAQGALILEWPERIRELIPEEHLWIQFEHAGEEVRQLRFEPQGKRYMDLVGQISESVHGGS